MQIEKLETASYVTKFVITLLFLLLSGCDKIVLPKLDDHERCVVSIEHSVCRCHIYRVSGEKIGRVSDSINKPLEYCDKLVGFNIDTWGSYFLWFHEVFEAVNDSKEVTKPDIESESEVRKLTIRD